MIARKTGFIERKSKIDAFKFLTCLIFNESEQKDTSLLNLKLDFMEQHDCAVSRIAIHKRFNAKAVEYMKAVLFQHIAQRFAPYDGLSSKFTSISIKDSTKFSIPKNLSMAYPGFNGFHPGQAMMNLQYEFDLVSGDWKRFDITKATRNDQQDSKSTLDNIDRGGLLLRDLGYITMAFLNGVVKKEAYYVNRLPTSFNVYHKINGKVEKLDWVGIDKTMKKNNLDHIDLSVFLGKKEDRKSVV